MNCRCYNKSKNSVSLAYYITFIVFFSLKLDVSSKETANEAEDGDDGGGEEVDDEEVEGEDEEESYRKPLFKRN